MSDAVGLSAVRGPRLARRRRTGLVVGGLAVAVVALGLLELSIGELQVSLVDVLRVFLGRGTSLTEYVVHGREPRVVAAIVAGTAFGLAGGLFQTVLRNDLASPDILGITGGASVATVIGSLLLTLGGLAASALAFAGAVAVAGVIYALAWRGGVSGQRFVLVGIGVAFMVTALLGYVLTRADVQQAQVALTALVGGVGNAGWTTDTTAAVGLLVLGAVLVPLAPSVRMLQLGEDTATGLGVPATRRRAVLLAIAVLCAGVGVAAAGPLAFVAFMSAPVARRLVRGGSPALVPAALVGAVLVLAADFAGQHLPGAGELPAGVLTGAVGAPYLLWQLAIGSRTRGSS